MAYTNYIKTVQSIYIAYYQRPADPGGLSHWATELDRVGGNLDEIIDAFATSDEAEALYPSQTPHLELVDSIYQALFGRAPDPDGANFYIEALQKGKFPDGRLATPGRVALDILNGAQGSDRAIIDNKIEAANLFTELVDGRDLNNPEFGVETEGYRFAATYSGDDDINEARLFLQAVISSSVPIPTKTEMWSFIQEHVANEGDSIKVWPTQEWPTQEWPTERTFTLTPGNDFADTNGFFLNDGTFIDAGFKFSSGNEHINATQATLTAGDILVDSSSCDQDVLAVTWSANGDTGAAVVQNIETINVSMAANVTTDATMNLANFSGVKTIIVSGTPGAGLRLAHIDNTGVTIVDASGVTTAEGRLTVDFSTSTSATLTLTGSAGVDYLIGGFGHDTINGGASIDMISGGTGNDVINGGADNDFIIAGAGNDKIIGEAGNDSIYLGVASTTSPHLLTAAGSNTVVFEDDATSNGNDKIWGFNMGAIGTGGDVLDFTAFLGGNTVLAQVQVAGGAANVQGSNVVVITDNTFANAQTAGLTLAANAKYVVIQANGASSVGGTNDEANVFFVTTDGSGAVASTTQVATLVDIVAVGTALNFADANFI